MPVRLIRGNRPLPDPREADSRGLVAVSMLGKVKTTLQMIAIAILLANPPDPELYLVIVGYALLYVAAFMTLWSMVVYLHAAWPTLRDGFSRRA